MPDDDSSPAKVAVAIAPNGARRTKADHPAIPLTPDELAGCAADCLALGAALIHLHVRDADGGHLLDADAYRAATAAIRAQVGRRMVVQITTEAVGIYRPEQQMAVVRETRPEAVSLALRELLPAPAAEPAFADFLAWIKAERILPQFILYTPEEAAWLDGLHKRGLIPWDEPPVLYVLGRYTKGQTSAPADLLTFLAPTIPQRRHWSVCAFGRQEAACVTTAALLGGGVRVGFENNLTLPSGKIATGNQETLAMVVTAIESFGQFLMNAEEILAQAT